MKRTNYSLRNLTLALSASVLLFSCNKDDDNEEDGNAVANGPSTELIAIDGNSAFSHARFAESFDQLWTSQSRFMYSYTHELDANGSVLESVQDLHLVGSIGDNVGSTVHTENADGVIIASIRTTTDGDIVNLAYEYNLDGYISQLTKMKNGQVRDIVDFVYDANGNLLEKNHQELNNNDAYSEVFTYNSDNTVSTYSLNETNITYQYSGGNVVSVINVLEQNGSSTTNTVNYQYDSQNRLMRAISDIWEEEFEYNANNVVIKSMENGRVISTSTYEAEFTLVSDADYYYNGATLDYVRSKRYDANGRVSRKDYYTGTASNLTLVGYTEIDSRDASTGKKTLESIYNAGGTKLYYVEFDDNMNKSWFLANGSSIDESDISESWVLILVQ